MADRSAGNPALTRSVVHAPNGMAASSQPLASMAAIQMLQNGGNAFDAAVAAAAVLTVVEPMQTGLGGDMFALLYNQKNKKVEALNGSGRAPLKANREYYLAKGYKKIPQTGMLSLTTPGTVDGWAEILNKHGTMTFAQVLQPAIQYAEKGFPVSEIIAAQWKRSEELLRKNKEARECYLIEGKAPKEGDIFKVPHLANTLKAIAAEGRDAFYKGKIALEIADYVEKNGGLLSYEDLASHSSTWVKAISTNYKGYDVYQLPPNGQGIVTLSMLNILENFDLTAIEHNSAEYIHLLAEAKKLAYADRDCYIADPDFSPVPVDKMLCKTYARSRSQQIDRLCPMEKVHVGFELVGDTVYLSVVDKDRNVISFINSLYTSFGSGIVAGDTGVFLQNRAMGFSLEENHLNTLEPGKRSLHTIIPALVLKDEKPYFSFGVMGGDMQPQGQVQVFLNHVEYGMNVQEAGESPRFRHHDQGIALESDISAKTKLELMERGHAVTGGLDFFGGYQGIIIDPETNMLQGGSDPRKDGCAIGY